MFEDGDRLAKVLTAAAALALVVAVAMLVVVAMNATPPEGPDAEWSLSRLNDTHVQITHEGGDPVPASELAVTVDGRARPVSWSGLVSEGDTGTLRARGGQFIRLYWAPERGSRELLARWGS